MSDIGLMDRLAHRTGTKGAEVLDAAEGIVEAIVSGIGNRDSVADIVVHGAYDKSLEKRKPRVVWGHDWNHPIGKILEIREVPSNDPMLPEKMRREGIGGLYAKVQFNLLSQKGKEAFASVAFFGEDQEWSIGFKTIKSEYDPMRKANLLKEIELFEVSPVLHGANQLTGTVSIKSEHMSDAGDESAASADKTLTESLTEFIGSGVSIVKRDDTKIVFQTSDGDTFVIKYAEHGGEYLFGTPHKVHRNVVYTEAGPPVSHVTKPTVEQVKEGDHSIDDVSTSVVPSSISTETLQKDALMGYDTELEATKRSLEIGCVGFHESNGKFFPCVDDTALRRSLQSEPTSKGVIDEALEVKVADLASVISNDDMKRLAAALAVVSDFGKAVGKLLNPQATPAPQAPQPPAAAAATAPPAAPPAAQPPPPQKSLQLEIIGEADMASITDALDGLRLKVDGTRIVFDADAPEGVLKQKVAAVLTEHGVIELTATRVAGNEDE